METEDCFQVGLIAYHDKDFERAKEWMVEGLRKFQPTIYSGYLSRKVLQEFVAWCEYEVGWIIVVFFILPTIGIMLNVQGLHMTPAVILTVTPTLIQTLTANTYWF